MKSALRVLLLFLFAAGAALAAERAVDSSSDGAGAPQQVLVMLNLPPDHFRPDASYGGGYGDRAGRVARRRIASELAERQRLRIVDDWPMPMLGVDCFVMELSGDRSTGDVVRYLSRDPRVIWAQPMNLFVGMQARDPLYTVQPAADGWALANLHEFAKGRSVSVAVVDSGVDREHPDLLGRVTLAENFVPGRAPAAEGHGTGIAGIIAARDDNGIGIVGIAPRTHLMALRACWQAPDGATLCSSLSLARAVYFAVTHGAAIINLSLGGPHDRLLARLLDVAMARGIAVVAAIDRADGSGGFPASHPGVVAVADDAPGILPAGALKAPGRDVLTTAPGGGWAFVSGSSYAAAHVTGLLALLREVRPALDGQEARALLAVRAAGDVDACATMARATGPCVCGCAATRAAAHH